LIETLVGRVFALRDAVHLEHWRTGSYAQHIALGDFCDEVIEKLDAIVETYQGLFDKIGRVTRVPFDPASAMDAIAQHADWITRNKEAISKGDASLNNMLDDLVALYSATYYKLKCLK